MKAQICGKHIHVSGSLKQTLHKFHIYMFRNYRDHMNTVLCKIVYLVSTCELCSILKSEAKKELKVDSYF